MNHELRTPLKAVIGFAETLAHDATHRDAKHRDATPDPEQTREFALHIRDAGRQLLALIDDMLDLVRLDSGAYELAADTLDLSRVLRACLRATAADARTGGLTVAVSAASGLPLLRADERRLRRLLGHLIGNALKFTGSGGRVDIAAGLTETGDLQVAVRDTGSGMAPEDLQRALQSFEQLDASLSRRAGGAGLGLHLCRALARAHGGTLTLQSQPGRGTTATLLLPRARLIALVPSLPLAQEPP
jgi:signal transduction histidine kinase